MLNSGKDQVFGSQAIEGYMGESRKGRVEDPKAGWGSIIFANGVQGGVLGGCREEPRAKLFGGVWVGLRCVQVLGLG
jgi:hypothetical protein